MLVPSSSLLHVATFMTLFEDQTLDCCCQSIYERERAGKEQTNKERKGQREGKNTRKKKNQREMHILRYNIYKGKKYLIRL